MEGFGRRPDRCDSPKASLSRPPRPKAPCDSALQDGGAPAFRRLQNILFLSCPHSSHWNCRGTVFLWLQTQKSIPLPPFLRLVGQSAMTSGSPMVPSFEAHNSQPSDLDCAVQSVNGGLRMSMSSKAPLSIRAGLRSLDPACRGRRDLGPRGWNCLAPSKKYFSSSSFGGSQPSDLSKVFMVSRDPFLARVRMHAHTTCLARRGNLPKFLPILSDASVLKRNRAPALSFFVCAPHHLNFISGVLRNSFGCPRFVCPPFRVF